MSEKWIAQVRHTLDQKSTAELLQIWQANDRQEWSDEAFIAIRQILEARGEIPGLQAQPGSTDEPAQASRRQRPGCVTFLAILIGIGAVLPVLRSILGILGRPYVDDGSKIEIGITLAFAILYIAVAVGLWQLKNWARIAFIVLQSLGILLLIALIFSGLALPGLIGLAVGGYSIYWFATHGEDFKPAAPSAMTDSNP